MDTLKIEKLFVADVRAGERGEPLATLIISMAYALDMEVVAEGVETSEQRYFLQVLACDEIQGYFISKPLTADLVAHFL